MLVVLGSWLLGRGLSARYEDSARLWPADDPCGGSVLERSGSGGRLRSPVQLLLVTLARVAGRETEGFMQTLN